MQVSKWGNSLAIRLPTAVVKALGLKEGDEIEVRAKDDTLEVEKKASIRELFARVHALNPKIPADYKFEREEANSRGGGTED